jgi:hypothetical protein
VAAVPTWTPYEDDGYEMTDPQEFKTRHFFKRYMKNSEKMPNDLLDQRIRGMTDKFDRQKASSALGSLNMTNHLTRETKMLGNYDKYQKIWYKNLQKFEVARNGLNNREYSKNHKANGDQTQTDMTLIDRYDFFENER